MRMMKKLVSSILSLVLVISMLYGFSMPSVKAASSGTCGDNLTWVLDDEGTLTISGTGDMTDFTYDPNTISCSAPWYSSSASIDKVVISNGVTSIGNYAFKFCGSLTSVTIGNGVKSIGNYAFKYCSSLTSVEIPDSVTSIGDYTFSESGLTSVTIPDSITSIGDGAFSQCYGLKSVTIGNGITSIGNYVFEYCRSLTSVEIPDSVTSIGEWAFYGCSSLTSVEIPDSVTSIGYSVFEECHSLTSVEIPDSLESIGEYAFYDCYNLESVTIGNGVTSIEYGTFEKCRSLTSVTIGNGVTSIGDSVFDSCSSLTSVEIPDGVMSIGAWTFARCSSLTSVTLGKGISSIGSCAFRDDNSLNDVYYNGTRKNRANITIKSANEPLLNATWHYNSQDITVPLTYTLPSLANTAKGIKVTFSKVEGATHYQICRRLKASDKGDPVESAFTVVKTIADNTNNSSKINYYDTGTATGKNGNTYVYYIRPVVMENGAITVSGHTKNAQIRRISTPAIKSCVNSGARTVTIKWSKNTLATGYDVWYSDGTSKNQIRIKNKTTVSKVVKGLKKGKKYTFKVRAFYITAAGVVYKSAWKPAVVKITR